MDATARPHRGTIFVEDAEVLAQEHFDADQHVLRLHAPKCAIADQLVVDRGDRILPDERLGGHLVADGGTLSLKDYIHPRVEPEIAFLLKSSYNFV